MNSTTSTLDSSFSPSWLYEVEQEETPCFFVQEFLPHESTSLYLMVILSNGKKERLVPDDKGFVYFDAVTNLPLLFRYITK